MNVVVESPMSFTGSFKRTCNAFADLPSFARWSAVTLILALWWTVVLFWYLFMALFVAGGMFLPLFLIIPYRTMRRSQRRERAMRAEAARRMLGA